MRRKAVAAREAPRAAQAPMDCVEGHQSEDDAIEADVSARFAPIEAVPKRSPDATIDEQIECSRRMAAVRGGTCFDQVVESLARGRSRLQADRRAVAAVSRDSG